MTAFPSTYDEDNNLISAVDAQKNATKFEYNENSDLTGITDPKGSKFKYEYDAKHNVTKGTSAMGVVSRLLYDANGNITKSGAVDPSAPDKGIWVNRTFTSDKNHVASVTDAEGNKTQYAWNTAADLLTSLTDGRGSRLTYGYDDAERLTSVSQDVTVGGVKKTVKNTYTYTKDKLTAIDHNGFRYGFGYDMFGNTTSASIAGNHVVAYTYEAKNGKISKVTYANGDVIRYTYDSQERLNISYYKAAGASAEQKLNSHVYGKEGNLCQVTNHLSGKTYYLDYDFLDRLMRVRDEKGSFYEYTYDANNHMIRMIHQAGASHITTLYTYDKDGREQTTKVRGGYTKTTAYDKYGRASGITLGTKKNFEVKFTYPSASGNQERALPSSVTAGQRTLSYKYDQNGNITSVQENPGSGGTVKTDTFQYDERNQLIRENSQTQNKTFVYEYDEGGNLTAVKEYAYTTAASLPAAEKTETGSYSSTWKDQLLIWNGTAMTYDTVGNMLTRGNTSYTWTQGRKLSGVNNGKSIQYSYDHTGARVKKTVDGVTTEYRMAGDLLVSETTNGQTFWYHYDSGANLVSMVVGGKNYFYVRNLQNDVIALVDEEGNEVVHYTYDSWGKILSITGSLKDTVGQQNPFRYRGYFYDTETGMYYLKSRYYDPELRRFISADAIAVTSTSLETLHNQNLYAYCDGNPLTRKDDDGGLWMVAGAGLFFLAGAATSIATQMVFDHKKITEINPVDVIASGIGSALGVIGISRAAQVAFTIGGSVLSSLYDGESLKKSIINGAIDGVWDLGIGEGFKFFGVAKDNYLDCTRRYKKAIYEVSKINLHPFEALPLYLKEEYLYMDQVDRIGKTGIKTAPISGTLPKAIPAGAKALSGIVKIKLKKRAPLRLIFMYDEILWVY